MIRRNLLCSSALGVVPIPEPVGTVLTLAEIDDALKRVYDYNRIEPDENGNYTRYIPT